MNAPVDVIGLLVHVEALLLSAGLGQDQAIARARGAVYELLAADRALDAIDAELPCSPEAMPDPLAYLRRRQAAQDRRAAALAGIAPA